MMQWHGRSVVLLGKMLEKQAKIQLHGASSIIPNVRQLGSINKRGKQCTGDGVMQAMVEMYQQVQHRLHLQREQLDQAEG